MSSPELHPYSAPAGHSGAFPCSSSFARSDAVAAPAGAVAGGYIAALPASASAAPAALGIEERTDDQKRARAFLHKRQLSNEMLRLKGVSLLRAADAPGAASLALCGTKPIAGGSVSLRLNTATGRASFGGLRRCGSVWTCARCSSAISLRRRDEMNAMLKGARAEGLAVYMVTLTARHNRDTDLSGFLSAMGKAKRRLVQRREWRALPYEGSCSATEVTHGNNGYHAHFHMLVLLSGDTAAGFKSLRALAPVWRTCLSAFDLSGGKASFDVRDGSTAGDYVSKWGAAEELALGGEKTPKVAGSRTPFELLADAADGDPRAARLWVSYAKAFYGKRQLVWSRGLKARFGIGETSDEAAAEAAEQSEAAAADVQVLAVFTAEEWEIVRHRQFALLRAAERGACLDRAMRGPLDCERWQRLRRDVWEVWL